jgi:mRNA interferase MazF
MKEGDVALTPIPQANGLIKNRPVVLLRQMPVFGDFLVCGISTQLHQEVKNFDECISLNDTDFLTSGLKASSIIRLGFLAALPLRNIVGAIGFISTERHHRLLNSLCKYLEANTVRPNS